MFLDASAIVAILAREDDWRSLLARIEQSAGRRYTSPIAIYEAVAGVARIFECPVQDAQGIVTTFLEEIDVGAIHITDSVGSLAIEAFAKYGKGRHPAALNMGDCFAYACAKAYRVALLFKGNDFAKTDIKVA